MGLVYISANLERLVLFTYPSLVLILSFFVHKKLPNFYQLGSLSITYIGLYFIFNEALGESSSLKTINFIKGATLVFASAFSFACYMVFSDKFISKIGAKQYTSLVMTHSSLIMLSHFFFKFIFETTTEGKEFISIFNRDLITYGLILAVFCTVIPSYCFSYGMKYLGSGNTALIGTIGPVITIVLANIFLGEVMTQVQIFGSVLIMLGVFLIKGKKS